MKGFRVLQALSNDMKHIFYDVRFNYDRGPDIEDKNRKYEAVEFLMNETNLTYEECSKANDFHIRLNNKN